METVQPACTAWRTATLNRYSSVTTAMLYSANLTKDTPSSKIMRVFSYSDQNRAYPNRSHSRLGETQWSATAGAEITWTITKLVKAFIFRIIFYYVLRCVPQTQRSQYLELENPVPTLYDLTAFSCALLFRPCMILLLLCPDF